MQLLFSIHVRRSEVLEQNAEIMGSVNMTVSLTASVELEVPVVKECLQY